MKVIVLGAGVIGVSTAWYLARAGVQVTVVDRQTGPGLETSFANAGQISPGYSTPWGAPGIPFKAMKWLLQRNSPLSIRPDGSLFQLEWLYAMYRNCAADRYETNKERMLRLASFSRQCLIDLRRDIGNPYEGRQGGTLQVFRKSQQLEAARRDCSILERLGIEHQLLGANELRQHEPALACEQNHLVGGLRLPLDETGDCHQFTQALTRHCQSLGVEFLFNREVTSVTRSNARVNGITLREADPEIHSTASTIAGSKVDSSGTRAGLNHLSADAVVVALGSYSRQFALQVGLSLPVYPLKGYSLTIPIQNHNQAPQSTVMDESFKVAVTRFDDRIRVGGMAEVSGHNLELNPSRRKTLEHVVSALFPTACDPTAATFWTGLRPMTPDSTPIVGRSGMDGLWLNTGHGTLGWTMACGSARLLSELITGASPSISPEGLDITRYSRTSGQKKFFPKFAVPV